MCILFYFIELCAVCVCNKKKEKEKKEERAISSDDES